MSNYIRKRKEDWAELERLVKTARSFIGQMKPKDLMRLDVLYRQTTVHLAQVATHTRDSALVAYLNSLTAAAHSLIYLPPKPSPVESTRLFVLDGFARAVARTWRFHLASVLLITLGFLIGYISVEQDPIAAYAIMPAMETRLPGSSQEQLLQALRNGRGMGSGEKFVFSAFLFSHNLQVGLLTLAAGILAAAPSVILLVYNGMILGAFTAIHHSAGIYAEYWAWILPHGVTEMSAIALAGGVGLQLGLSVVCPGVLTRGESLLRAGRESAVLTAGIAVMLIFAAAVESFLRQSHLPMWARYLFALGTVIFWASYFIRGARIEWAQALQQIPLAQ